ncbi:hypothetical protein KIK06_27035 [Nocardiopsis sp. EMB25]|uniref:hypothetical protein n=1 Tax=Nocardiopsis TaxID=2013 RepID=UPI00034DE6BE|nr:MULTISPECIES: hypothetical protein [Nocardiopsis]MCY9787539.1 hypothetical protein [Nocardiopsis sp. EMB25]
MAPVDAAGPTQHIQAVPAAPSSRNDRPLYRDEVPENAGADTAQFDLQDLDDYDGYPDQRSDRSRSSGGGRTKILLIAGFVALLVVAGGGAFLFARNGASSDGATGPEGPLSAESLFPETIDVEGAGTFTRVVTEDAEDCATAAHGDYGTVLTEQGCEQVVRASYLNEDETRAVTVGIATMATEGEAVTAQGEQDLVAAKWFAGLAGEEGSGTERLGFAGGYGSSGQWGNHIVFSLAANKDGNDAEEDSEVATELQTIGEGFLGEAFTLLTGSGG